MNDTTLQSATPGEIQQIASPVQFLSSVTFSELPETPVLTAQNGAPVISVLNTTRIRFTNTGATVITNFTNPQNGQNILVLGDGQTTVSNNTNIQTSTGANKLLANGRVYSFTYFVNKWYEASP